MDASPEPGAHRLTPADEERLPGLIAGVLAADPPVSGLLDVLTTMELEQNPALAVAVFESVVWRVNVNHYWVWFRVSRSYALLGPGREDATFITSAMAAQMQPDWLGSTQAFRDLFLILNRRGRAKDAVDLFNYQMDLHPQAPAAEPHEIAPLLERIAVALPAADDAPSRPGSRTDHPAIAADIRPPWTCVSIGGATPYSLRPLGIEIARPAIAVAALPDAEMLICQDSTVVYDRDGRLHEDLSVS